ncbi:MAG: ExeM/NucH family extracellular endonuclease, partial [Brevibacterium linens]
QGASNADRVKQAESLVGFADDQQEAADTNLVYLLGDFNSYTQEDPMQVFYEAGYKDIAAEKTDESTYVYGSRTGSLDHVLALDASDAGEGAGTAPSAFGSVTGADVWNINSVESIGLEYSRFNYNIADLFAPDQFRASDHDPVVVGLFDSSDEGGDDDGSDEADAGDNADGSGDDANADGSSDHSGGKNAGKNGNHWGSRDGDHPGGKNAGKNGRHNGW